LLWLSCKACNAGQKNHGLVDGSGNQKAFRRVFTGLLAKLAPDEHFTLYVDSEARRIGNDFMSGKHEFQMNLLCSRVQIDLEDFKRLVVNLPKLSKVLIQCVP
jgi:hypothetical protein